MLKLFRRRRNRAAECGIDDGLVVRDLLDHPALQAVMNDMGADDLDPDATISMAWARLMAGGPLRFDHSESTEVAA